MLHEQVDFYLASYKECLGRVKHLRILMQDLEREIEERKHLRAEHLVNSKRQTNDGMPKSSEIGNPTERMGIILADGEDKYAENMEEELLEKRTEFKEKQRIVEYVEAWLEGLTVKEVFMIEGKVFEEKTYREMAAQYESIFGESCSRDKLRELRKTAMQKIYKMAE